MTLRRFSLATKTNMSSHFVCSPVSSSLLDLILRFNQRTLTSPSACCHKRSTFVVQPRSHLGCRLWLVLGCSAAMLRFLACRTISCCSHLARQVCLRCVLSYLRFSPSHGRIAFEQ